MWLRVPEEQPGLRLCPAAESCVSPVEENKELSQGQCWAVTVLLPGPCPARAQCLDSPQLPQKASDRVPGVGLALMAPAAFD